MLEMVEKELNLPCISFQEYFNMYVCSIQDKYIDVEVCQLLSNLSIVDMSKLLLKL